VSKRDLDTWCECCHDTVQCCKCVERCRSTRKPKALQNATTSVSASELSLIILPVILYGPPSIKIVTLRSFVHYKVDRCGRTTCRSPVASVCAIYFKTTSALVEILKPCENPARTVLYAKDCIFALYGRDLERRIGARRRPM
jgi:hypothetical protein